MAECDRSSTHAHLVGGGIASLAAAAILIRDGDMLGKNITVYEQLDLLGGVLLDRGRLLGGNRALTLRSAERRR